MKPIGWTLRILLAGVALPGMVQAQEAQSDPAPATARASQKPIEIIVTAQKRSQLLSEVPLSITVANADQLADAGATTPADLAKIVSGLTYRPSDFGAPIFYIRGIGFNDVALAIAPAVSVYVDQVPLPFLVMTQGATLDLERVEVLKGPQGTLFGQNSTGGAVNFIAAKPTETFEAGFDVTYGRYNQLDVQGVVSGPLAPMLKARLAVRHEGRDAWQISQTRPDDRLGERDFTNARFLLDWQPSETVKLEFNANGWLDKSETPAPQFVALVPAAPPPFGPDDLTSLIAATYTGPAPRNPRIADWGNERPAILPPYVGQAPDDFRKDDGFYQFSLRGDVELTDDITLTSLSAYSRLSQNAPVDNDGTAFNDFYLLMDGSIESFSQELRVAGAAGPLRWMLGGNYAHDKSGDDQYVDAWSTTNGLGPIRYATIIFSNHQKVTTAAVFGSVDYEITPTVTLQGSMRYTDQTNKFDGCMRDAGDGQIATAFSLILTGAPIVPGSCVTAVPNTAWNPFDPTSYPFEPAGLIRKELKEDNLSWRAGVDWKPTPDTMVYANVTRGYKAGVFPTVPTVVPSQLNPVTQESVTAYEAGFKATFLDRKVGLTGAAFYYDYKNKQVLGYVPEPTLGLLLPSRLQVPKASVRGFELSLTARPVEGLTFIGGMTYVDSEVEDDGRNGYDPNGVPTIINGESFPDTPKWQFNGDISYGFAVSPSLRAVFGGNVRHQSSTTSAFGGLPEYDIPAHAVVDLRAGVEHPDGAWKAQVWGRNVGNKFYITGVSHSIDVVSRNVGMGATYGVTLSFRY